MARLIDRPLIGEVAPVVPEHLVGDVIQSGHPLFGLVWINPERVSGSHCFYRTRVPVKALFDSLAAGPTLEEFLVDFEGSRTSKNKRRSSCPDLTCLKTCGSRNGEYSV